jgi:hypothetical protein
MSPGIGHDTGPNIEIVLRQRRLARKDKFDLATWLLGVRNQLPNQTEHAEE